ncbi:MAG: hypothetical protein ABIM44_07160 [candidate division WOR-3 bacterium]
MTVEETLREKLKTIRDRVLYVMENYPETRNNDLYLWLIYVRLFDNDLSRYIKFIPYQYIKSAVSFETISRVRRKVQEEGFLLPTDPETLRRRRRLEKAFRRVMPRISVGKSDHEFDI